ncbi:MAG: peptidylprolyl isomerase [Gemmatimonadota bacterium]
MIRNAALAFTLLAVGCASAGSGGRPLDAAARRTLLLDPTHPEWTRPAPPVSNVTFTTTKGDFTIAVVRDWAPIAADRFYNLARLGYYDDTRFHRVSDGYIVQWGLHGDPAVNDAWRGRELPDDPQRFSNAPATIGFAMEGPRTRNTQVYINVGDNSRNDGEPFAIFGSIVEGMDVVRLLYSGYGEASGSGMRQNLQGPIEAGGNAYLDREFPLLDRTLYVTVNPRM